MAQAYTITEHKTHLHLQIADDFDIKAESKILTDKLNSSLDARSNKTFIIIEVGNITWGIDDIIAAASLSARGGNAYLHHKNMRQLILISSIKAFEMVLKGLNSPVFGNIQAKAFPSYAEALTYINQQG